jgi:hypothetical protein
MATSGVLAWIGAITLWVNRSAFVEWTITAWTRGGVRGQWWLRLGEVHLAEARRWAVGGVRAVTLILAAMGIFAWLAALGLNTEALVLFVGVFLLSPFAFLFLTPPSD